MKKLSVQSSAASLKADAVTPGIWIKTSPATCAAITSGRLSPLPAAPIGQVSRSAPSRPARRRQPSNDARFDADPAGTAVLQIQWSVIGPGEEFVIQPRRARYEATAARPGDYPALALAMSEVLQQFSRDVAQALRHLAGGHAGIRPRIAPPAALAVGGKGLVRIFGRQ